MVSNLRSKLIPGLLALIICSFASSKANAAGPTETVRAAIAELQGLSVAEIDGGKKKEKLHEIMLRRVDFNELVRQALGTYAVRYGERIPELAPLIVVPLERLTLQALPKLKDFTFVFGDEEGIGKGNVRVTAKFGRGNIGEVTSATFWLCEVDGEWRVYNVEVDVAPRFNAAVYYWVQIDATFKKNKSFDELLNMYRELAKDKK